MLVTSRKAGQDLVIDGGIVVRVLKVKGSRVTIGVEAPREISVRRGELANWQPADDNGADTDSSAQDKEQTDGADSAT